MNTKSRIMRSNYLKLFFSILISLLFISNSAFCKPVSKKEKIKTIQEMAAKDPEIGEMYSTPEKVFAGLKKLVEAGELRSAIALYVPDEWFNYAKKLGIQAEDDLDAFITLSLAIEFSKKLATTELKGKGRKFTGKDGIERMAFKHESEGFDPAEEFIFQKHGNVWLNEL